MYILDLSIFAATSNFDWGGPFLTRLHEVARKACVSADGLIGQLLVTVVFAAPATINWKSP